VSSSQAGEGRRSGRSWLVVGASVQGAQHKRKNLTNQDSFFAPGQELPPGHSFLLTDAAYVDLADEPLVIAVADGHGDPRSFRSHTGSALAVRAAASVVQGFLRSQAGVPGKEGLDRVATEMVSGWRSLVEADLAGHPYSEKEELIIKEASGGRWIPYGSTLLCAGFTANFGILLQLGDGDILVIERTGEVSRGLPPDPGLLANYTTSLSQKDAAAHVRTAVLPWEPRRPRLVVLATDGLGNSFVNDGEFFKFASDIEGLILAGEEEQLFQQLPRWLGETSTEGSGDDITTIAAWPDRAQEARAVSKESAG
jgi:hypothetical protein